MENKLVKVSYQSEWHEERCGGSHLYTDKFNKVDEESWSKNPKFLLKCFENQTLLVNMSRKASEWAKRS